MREGITVAVSKADWARLDAIVSDRNSGHAERPAAPALIEDHADASPPVTLGADKGYDGADFVRELRSKAVTPHVE
jgi:hypothetical protein